LPLVVFQEEEQAKLLPYDSEPYDVPDWHKAIVHRDHHIIYRYGHLLGTRHHVSARYRTGSQGDRELVRLYKRGELVKVHSRKPRGGRSTDPDDYPKELNAHTLRSPIYLCRKVQNWGSRLVLLRTSCLGVLHRGTKCDRLIKLLRLGDKYTPLRLNSACEKALAVDLIDVRRVERILIDATGARSNVGKDDDTAAAGTIRPSW